MQSERESKSWTNIYHEQLLMSVFKTDLKFKLRKRNYIEYKANFCFGQIQRMFFPENPYVEVWKKNKHYQ